MKHEDLAHRPVLLPWIGSVTRYQDSAEMFPITWEVKMKLRGRCHCGAISYEIDGTPIGHSLCHCSDCRRHAGAPMVGWAMFPAEAVKTVQGRPKIYNSSEHGRRHFCERCGTGLFYSNSETLPGIIDVQSATLDEPDLLPAECHTQAAERISWVEKAHELPVFERYPPPP